MMSIGKVVSGATLLASVATSVFAESSSEELAKQLANPIASLISVPFQLNYDENLGPNGDGDRFLLNIQPVIPFSLNDEWNVITRTIIPLISNDGIVPDDSEDGLGNVLFSAWASPKAPTANGWIWGVGPAVQLPTSSDDQFGEDQWALGPTAIALRQNGPWTIGGLTNHLWDVSGDTDINNTFVQPFVSYTTPTAVTYSVTSESSYNWDSEEWSIPINFVVSKVATLGQQPVQFQGGVRYWVDSPSGGAEDIGFRLGLTFMFPKK